MAKKRRVQQDNYTEEVFALKFPRGKVMIEEDEEERYKMNHARRGIALILYHENFDDEDLETRKGFVEDDVSSLKRSLERLGFQVEPSKDLTYAQIKSVLRQVANMNHEDNDCLLVVVMTLRGNVEGHIYARDGEYKTSELWGSFLNCLTLMGKPKLFLVQQDLNKTGNVEARKYCLPNQEDYFVVYSTEKDSYEAREEGKGSFFIECLCKELDQNGKLKDLYKIMTAVNKHLTDKEKNTLEIHSKLLRDLYL